MMEPKIFNYGESTYNVKEFGATKEHNRVDVTYFAKVRSKNALLQRLLKLPHMTQATANWIRKRISKGSGGMEKIITDDSIYVRANSGNKFVSDGSIIGKFTLDNQWVPFDPPLKLHRPWLGKRESEKTVKVEASVKLGWKVHTTDLFKEISSNIKHNPQVRIPLQILQNLLGQVAQRAIELNDPQLNKLMIRLTLYSIADPNSPDYDYEAVSKILKEKTENE